MRMSQERFEELSDLFYRQFNLDSTVGVELIEELDSTYQERRKLYQQVLDLTLKSEKQAEEIATLRAQLARYESVEQYLQTVAKGVSA